MTQPRILALFWIAAALNLGGFLLSALDVVPLKPFGLASIVIYALLLRARDTEKRFARGVWLCFAGDVTLALGFVPVALLFFCGGYGTYVVAMTEGRKPRFAQLAIALLVALAGWYVAVYLGTAKPFMLWASLVYSLVLGAMPGVARRPLHAAAGAIFLASDILIGMRMFRLPLFQELVPPVLQRDVVWLTYALGQALVTRSVIEKR